MEHHEAARLLAQVKRPPARHYSSDTVRNAIEQHGRLIPALVALMREPGALPDADVTGGMPVDRTICPDCLNTEGSVEGCELCSSSGSVCPACRGFRVVLVVQGKGDRRPLYQACPDCCDPLPAARNSEGWPRYQRNVEREVRKIVEYREKYCEEPF